MIILDTGSGNGQGNSISYQKEVIDSIADNKGDLNIIIKYQLFLEAGINKPLKRGVFEKAFQYAKKKGIQVTASVFDMDSLRYLQEFDIPFIKLANNDDCHKLARGIKTPMVVSYPAIAEMGKRDAIIPLCCVSRYPAQMVQYEHNFTHYWLTQGISDHTEGFEMYHKYEPSVYEKHYILKHDKTNPDGGVFAMTADDWGEL
jgi:sialic acid synthase SpsE